MIGDVVSVSQLLRSKREELGYDIRSVAHVIKIRTRYLSAIEKGEFSDIPARVYLLSYIRNYAYYLGLNGDNIVQQFKDSHGIQIDDDKCCGSDSYSVDTRPRKILVLMTVIVVALLYNAWYLFHTDKDRVFVHQYPVPSKILGSNTDQKMDELFYFVDNMGNADKRSNVNLNSPAMVAYLNQFDDSNARIVILSRGSTHMRVVDKHNRLLAETQLSKGDTYFVPNDSGISILANQPQLLDVYIEGDNGDNVAIPHILSDSGKTIFSNVYQMSSMSIK